jgi:hypothetical protein
MSSLPVSTLNRFSFVASRTEFCPLKCPHRPKCLPFDEGSLLLSGYGSSEDLLFPLGSRGASRKTSLLLIPKRGVEV